MLLQKDVDIYFLSWFSVTPDPAIVGFDRPLINAGDTDTRWPRRSGEVIVAQALPSDFSLTQMRVTTGE